MAKCIEVNCESELSMVFGPFYECNRLPGDKEAPLNYPEQVLVPKNGPQTKDKYTKRGKKHKYQAH